MCWGYSHVNGITNPLRGHHLIWFHSSNQVNKWPGLTWVEHTEGSFVSPPCKARVILAWKKIHLCCVYNYQIYFGYRGTKRLGSDQTVRLVFSSDCRGICVLSAVKQSSSCHSDFCHKMVPRSKGSLCGGKRVITDIGQTCGEHVISRGRQ